MTRLRSVLFAVPLALTACSSSSFVRVVSVNPPDASVYINGERVGQGSSRPQTFDFSQCDEIFVQATHPDYQPELERFTLQKMKNMMATNTEVRLTLRPR